MYNVDVHGQQDSSPCQRKAGHVQHRSASFSSPTIANAENPRLDTPRGRRPGRLSLSGIITQNDRRRSRRLLVINVLRARSIRTAASIQLQQRGGSRRAATRRHPFLVFAAHPPPFTSPCPSLFLFRARQRAFTSININASKQR